MLYPDVSITAPASRGPALSVRKSVTLRSNTSTSHYEPSGYRLCCAGSSARPETGAPALGRETSSHDFQGVRVDLQSHALGCIGPGWWRCLGVDG